MDDDHYAVLMNKVDKDGDGKISYGEFLKYFAKGQPISQIYMLKRFCSDCGYVFGRVAVKTGAFLTRAAANFFQVRPRTRR